MLADKLREHIDAAFRASGFKVSNTMKPWPRSGRWPAQEGWKVLVEEPNPEYDPISFIRATLALEGLDTTLVVLPTCTSSSTIRYSSRVASVQLCKGN